MQRFRLSLYDYSTLQPFDSSGTFQRVIPGGWKADAAANIKIRADRHDLEDDGFAAGLSNCLTKNGLTQPTANLPMNGKKLTGVGEPTGPQDAATKNYVDTFKSFTTGAVIAGAGSVNGTLLFSSPSGDNGLAWTGADLSWRARMATATPVTINRLALNDKVDGTGADVVEVREDGSIKASSVETTGSITAAANLTVTGTVTTANVVASGTVYSGQVFQSTATSVILATTGAGAVYLRPNGAGSGAGQVVLDSAGTLGTSGGINAGSSITAPVAILPTAYFGTGLGAGSFAAFRSGTQRIYQLGANIYISTVEGDDTLNIVMTGGATAQLRNDKAFIIQGQGFKPGGGSWAATSDGRAKNVLGAYDRGLAAIKALCPVRYTYKGNDTWKPNQISVNKGVADDGTEFVGFVAQDIEKALPGMVRKTKGFIDGKPVSDLRMSDPSELIYALLNAVKELAAKVEALEAAA